MILDVSLKKKMGSFQFNSVFTISGSRVGIFGPSGSGKSTFMHLLAGLLKPDDGYIKLDGVTLFDSKTRIHVPPEKRRIGVVFQHAQLFPHMNVKQNLFYGFKRITPSDRRIDPDLLIEVLNLEPLLERQVNRLSGGERQRVALGRTILACPKLILMDEPLTGLDLTLKYQIIPYLKRVLNEFDIPLLFISHSIEEMRLMTNGVLVFKNGCFEKCVSAEDLARQTLASGGNDYANLLTLTEPKAKGDLWRYTWGNTSVILTEPGLPGDNLFELSAKDIMLFKRHPEASSARNLLTCTVREIFLVGNRVGIELDCYGNRLICQIVPDSVKELDIQPGSDLVAAIKATAFRRIY